MWPNYYLLEARRLAAERTLDAELAEMAREAALYREAHRTTERRTVRRVAAQLALAVSHGSVRLARALDDCVVSEGQGGSFESTQLG